MRSGQFEVLVNDNDGNPFREEIIGGKSYICSQPGSHYHVQINVHKDLTGKFPFDHLRLGLYVDGYDVQYWKRLDFGEHVKESNASYACSKFWGFKTNHNSINSFVFSETHIAENNNTVEKSSPSNDDQRGTIKVVIYRCMMVDGVYDNRSNSNAHNQLQSVSDQEKFWKQPTLTTIRGDLIGSEKEKFVPLKRWVNIDKEPLHTFILYYHTPKMIDLLKKINQEGNFSVSSNVKDPIHSIEVAKRKLTDDFSAEENESNPRKKVATTAETDVEIIIPTKYVPFLDLTTNESSWDTKKL